MLLFETVLSARKSSPRGGIIKISCAVCYDSCVGRPPSWRLFREPEKREPARKLCKFCVQWMLKLSSGHLVQVIKEKPMEDMLPVAYGKHEWLQSLHAMTTEERHVALKTRKRTTPIVGAESSSMVKGVAAMPAILGRCRRVPRQ